MVTLLWVLIGILFCIIFILIGKIHLLRKSTREISDAFSNRLTTDTNTLIDISSRDPYMRKLADDMNIQLRLLRKQRHKYLNGDRELKESVTNISHDLRTPLTVICGYMDLLKREAQTETTTRYLSLIENRVETIKQMTEELFRYSVTLSTQENLKLETVCLNHALEESIAEFYGALTERSITPVISITEKTIERELNPDALSRVFSNILNNALKYSDGDLEIRMQEDGLISFSNSASSLSEIEVGKLFNRFFTVETARNSSGLGLSIVKSLVEHMGGTITATYAAPNLTILLRF